MNPLLQALQCDQRGDWEQAHRIVQDLDSTMAARIHAYLHRKEGDLGNAGYWYRAAGVSTRQDDLAQEWQDLWEACQE